jgi:hypothetical protein
VINTPGATLGGVFWNLQWQRAERDRVPGGSLSLMQEAQARLSTLASTMPACLPACLPAWLGEIRPLRHSHTRIAP